jgi:serine protease Do
MKPLLYLCSALYLLIASAATAAEVPPSFADLVEKLTPSVVNISTTQKVKGGTPGLQLEIPQGTKIPEQFKNFLEQFGKSQGENEGDDDTQAQGEHEVYSLGSGFIIDPDGYIATNNHVIANAEQISVTLSDDTVLKAKIVGRDPKTDLALLKVDAGHKLPAVPMGDSDKARVGDWVIAIGNPYAFGGTVTAGIISARARNINAGPYDDFIQTDAAINRGNSGGPLFNVKGEVIGINTAIFSPSGDSIGIGFAVPMSLAEPVLEQLRKTGHIERAWLGVKIQNVTEEIAESVGLKKAIGALVMEVTKGSPADTAGLQTGDVITRFDGKEVKAMRNLPLMVADTPIHKAVALELWRDGKSKTVNVTLAQLKDQDEASDTPGGNEDDSGPSETIKTKPLLGMSLATITPEVREKYGIDPSVKGVLVTKVDDGSEAMQHEVQQGDIITRMGDTVIRSNKDVSDALANARKAGRKFILVRVQHGQDALFITLPVEEEKSGK